MLVVAGWRRVYHARREGCLAQQGPYGVIRHPQYTGIMLALFGQIIHWPTIITVVLFPVIVIAYVLLARREERDMLRRFGSAYRDYMQRVPRFFPRRGHWRELFASLRA